jgi:hypothetical protein
LIGRNQQSANVDPAPGTPAAVAVAPALPEVLPDAPAPDATIPDATFVVGKSATPRGLVSVPPRPQHRTVRNPLLLTGNTQADAVLAAAVHQADNQLGWIETIQLPPVQMRESDDLHFAATLQTEGRPLGHRSPSTAKQTEPADEMVTFKFMK